jgi:hypothetical protein
MQSVSALGYSLIANDRLLDILDREEVLVVDVVNVAVLLIVERRLEVL